MTDRFSDIMSLKRNSHLSHVTATPVHVTAGASSSTFGTHPNKRVSLLDDGLVIKSGWMEKEGGFLKTWKKRYFVLHRSNLFYFEREEQAPGGAATCKASIIVSGATIRACPLNEVSGKPYSIGLTPSLTKREYILVLPNEETRIEWLSAFMSAGAREAGSSGNTTDNSKNARATSSDDSNTSQIARENAMRGRAGSAIGPATSSQFPPTTTERMFPDSLREGWLLKLGGVNKSKFQERYFAILGSHLMYFETPSTDSIKGSINLHECGIQQETDFQYTYAHPFVFSLTPKHQPKSLVRTILGEANKKYVLVASTEAELKSWIMALKTEIEREAPDEDEDDDEEEASEDDASEEETTTSNRAASPTFKPSKHTVTSVDTLTASTTSQFSQLSVDSNSSTSHSNTHFTGPSADVLSHCYLFDDSGGWKKSYYGLDVKSKMLRIWKHRPQAHLTPLKPKSLDLTGAKVLVNQELKCTKTKHHPSVLTITLPSISGQQYQPIHLAPSSKSHFDDWYSCLLLTLGKSRTTYTPPTPPTAKSSSKSPHPSVNTARRPSGTDSSSSNAAAPSPTNSNHSSTSTNSTGGSSRKTSRADTSGDSVHVPPASDPPLTQSQLLHEMSLVLSDDAAMNHFRLRSGELHRGVITPQQYFRSYFRLFGKVNGLRFWNDLLGLIPKDETKDELRDLFQQHQHLFAPDEPESTATPLQQPRRTSSLGQDSERPPPRHRQSSAPDEREREEEEEDGEEEDSPVNIAPLPSFTPSNPNSSTPSFSMSPASSIGVSQAASFSSSVFSPDSNASSFARETIHSAPATFSNESNFMPKSPSSSASATLAHPSPSPPIVDANDRSNLRDELTPLVDAWQARGESNIITLLCTLHEVMPDLVYQGQFIPFDEGYPTLKEVKSTYLKAMLVIHPDKTKGKSKRIQFLSELVFQSIQGAWERYEKSEKKKERKKAATQA